MSRNAWHVIGRTASANMKSKIFYFKKFIDSENFVCALFVRDAVSELPSACNE